MIDDGNAGQGPYIVGNIGELNVPNPSQPVTATYTYDKSAWKKPVERPGPWQVYAKCTRCAWRVAAPFGKLFHVLDLFGVSGPRVDQPKTDAGAFDRDAEAIRGDWCTVLAATLKQPPQAMVKITWTTESKRRVTERFMAPTHVCSRTLDHDHADDDEKTCWWTVVVHPVTVGLDSNGYGRAHFLVDAAPHELLQKPGNELKLYAGAKHVVTLKVLGDGTGGR